LRTEEIVDVIFFTLAPLEKKGVMRREKETIRAEKS
jgi:hypothetical protein